MRNLYTPRHARGFLLHATFMQKHTWISWAHFLKAHISRFYVQSHSQMAPARFAPQLFAFNNAYPFHYLLNSIATSVKWKCVLMYAHQIVVLWSSSNALADHHIKTVPHYHITALQCVLKAAAAAAVFLLFLLLLHQHVAHFLAIKSSLFNYRN